MYTSDLPYVKLVPEYSPLSPRSKLQRTLSDQQNEADIFDWYRTPSKPACQKTQDDLSKVEITEEDIRCLLAQAKQKVSQEKPKKKETTFRRLKKKLSKTLSS